MGAAVDLRTLIYDNASGAREVAVRTLQLLQRTCPASTAETPTELLDELAELGVKVLRSKPEMAPVFNAVNRFLLEAEAGEDSPDTGAFRIQTLTLLQDQVRRIEASIDQAARHAATLVENGEVVLTYSRSSTVLEAFKHAKAEGKLFDVVTAESRPNLEGRALAKELAEEQIPVRLVVDALLGTAIEGADRILLGADAITPDSLVNKAGSRLIAGAAQEHGIPLHVVADLGKAWVKRADPTVSLLAGRLRDPKEVWDNAPYGVEVVNLYFDLTPLRFTKGIACEEGVFPPSGYWERVRRRGYAGRLRRAFADELA